MKTNTVYQGDCLHLMKELPDNSIDLITTDPPYGIKIMGKAWDKKIPPLSNFQEMFRVLKPGAFCFVFSHARQDVLWRMMQRLEDAGFEIDMPSIYWTYATGMGLGSNCGKMIDKRLGVEKDRKIIGKGFHSKKSIVGEIGYKHGTKENFNYTAPASDLAKKYNEAYIRYRPKTCLEPILVAMKPVNTKTYIETVMESGKACTWLDRVRVPTDEENYYNTDMSESSSVPKVNHLQGSVIRKRSGGNDKGRYPANLLVQDDVLDTGKYTKSTGGPKKNNAKDKQDIYGKFGNIDTYGHGDSGSYSRYFSFDAWAREKLPQTFPFIVEPKPSKEQKRGRKSHLTEKPVNIFAYLITLASQPGDIVLDTYAGGGSSLLAAAGLNRDYLGFELAQEHVDIAVGRLGKILVKRDRREIGEII